MTKCAASGELHSHQRRRNGRRFITEATVDAWMQGLTEKRQIQACGCARLRGDAERSTD